MSYHNMKNMLDYGKAADFEGMAKFVHEADHKILGEDICKMILFFLAAIHPQHRGITLHALLKAETNQELAEMEIQDEQDGETDS